MHSGSLSFYKTINLTQRTQSLKNARIAAQIIHATAQIQERKSSEQTSSDADPEISELIKSGIFSFDNACK